MTVGFQHFFGKTAAPRIWWYVLLKPMNALPANIHQFQPDSTPEWLRVPAACHRFSVSRSWLYERITAGDIKTASLRKRGSIRGIRLVSRDSLAAFIEQGAE